MRHDQDKVRALYMKLLNLYARGFKVLPGEPIERTFNDLYDERIRQTKREQFSFLLWILVETTLVLFR